MEFVGIGHGHVLLDWYRFLIAERPDWLFWECAYHLWGPLVELAKLAGVRTIFATGCDLDVHPRQYRFHKSQYWRLYAWGLARTDKIFVQHAGQLSGLCPRWLPKTSILPKVCMFGTDGCAPVKLQPHAQRSNYVAWVGTLVQFKRPDILLEIARRATATRFVVCGGASSSPPEYGERIADQLRAMPNIEYLGQVPPDKAQRVIESASILLCTSDIEGFPNTFVQAWSSGTPVVSLKVDPDYIISQSGLGTVSGDMSKALEDIAVLMA
ncbi:MAG: glycosyltransferase, partial [Candidatus Binatia bacterium]